MFPFVASVKSWFGSILWLLREILSISIRVILALIFLGLLVCTVFLVLACIARIQLSYAQVTGKAPIDLTAFRWFSDVVARIAHIDLTTLAFSSQRDFTTGFSDLSITLFALVLALLSFGQFLRENIFTRGRSIIRRHRLYSSDDKDEPRIMNRYYKNALAVTLMSGDFSFIRNHERLLGTLRRLKGDDQLWLVSHKAESDVEAAMGYDLFAEFTDVFVFDQPLRIHCSLVQYPTGRVFLYREHHEPPGERPKAYIYAIRERSRSHALLRALATLTGHTANIAPK